MMKLDAEQLVGVLFGGPEKLDCWLTKAADQLTDPNLAKPVVLPSVPQALRELVNRPQEALDLMLVRLDDLGIWGYTVKVVDGLASVTDDLTGHLLEVVEIGEWPQINALADKYGQNVKVVQD
jgi:hypothetical protein